MAWELVNEPRCEGDFSGSVLQAWVEQSAEFLKSLDPHHLLTVGAEGFFGSSTPGVCACLLSSALFPVYKAQPTACSWQCCLMLGNWHPASLPCQAAH